MGSTLSHGLVITSCNLHRSIWVIWAWDKLKASAIVNGFRKCGIIFTLATDDSYLDDDSEADASDTEVNEDKLEEAIDIFTESDFDNSFDGFDVASHENE